MLESMIEFIKVGTDNLQRHKRKRYHRILTVKSVNKTTRVTLKKVKRAVIPLLAVFKAFE